MLRGRYLAIYRSLILSLSNTCTCVLVIRPLVISTAKLQQFKPFLRTLDTLHPYLETTSNNSLLSVFTSWYVFRDYLQEKLFLRFLFSLCFVSDRPKFKDNNQIVLNPERWNFLTFLQVGRLAVQDLNNKGW